MGIVLRHAEVQCEPFDRVVAERVFEPMCLSMHTVFRYLENGMQEHFCDAVFKRDLLSHRETVTGKADLTVRGSGEELLSREIFDALGDGRLAESQVFGDLRYADGTVRCLLQYKNSSDVVFLNVSEGSASHIS